MQILDSKKEHSTQQWLRTKKNPANAVDEGNFKQALTSTLAL